MPSSETIQRFEHSRDWGEGGMGVEYEARDRRSERIVAIKSLHSPDAAMLLRLKREFRVLQNITHGNLVRLDLHHGLDRA
jgi:serine/threonine protein kinase